MSTPIRTMTDVLTLAETQRLLVNWILRNREASIDQLSEQLQQNRQTLLPLLEELILDGFIYKDIQNGHYKTTIRTRLNRKVPQKIWDALE